MFIDTAISAATGAGSQINSDNIIEGSVKLFYTSARAKADTVVNSMTGSQTTLAPSVAAIKDYITNVAVTAGSALAYDPINTRELDVQVDDSSIYVNSNQLAVKDGGVTSSKLASNAVITAKLAADAVTDEKLRLRNDQSLRARNNADSADVEVLKVDTGDKILFSQLPRLPLNATPTIGQEVVSKSYVDNYFANLPQPQREVIPVTATHITNGYIELQNQVNPSGLVVYTNGRVMLMPTVSGAAGDYTLTVVNSKTRIVFQNEIASGGVSALEAYDSGSGSGDIIYAMYFPLTGSGKGQESIQTQIETPTNKAYTLMLSAPRSMAIEALVVQAGSGTCVVDVQINGVTVGNLGSISASTSKVTRLASTNNLIMAGDTVTLVVSENDNVVDLVFSLTIS
ncbi:MAG: hypothetical protein EBV30_10830 [Actinobacteria bacterium]|nr:hypothetical protein [Actinomycetota bacterium]